MFDKRNINLKSKECNFFFPFITDIASCINSICMFDGANSRSNFLTESFEKKF